MPAPLYELSANASYCPGAEVFDIAATQSGYGGTFPGCRMCYLARVS
jgi:hypothetical protein